jgi:hypothetical protein
MRTTLTLIIATCGLLLAAAPTAGAAADTTPPTITLAPTPTLQLWQINRGYVQLDSHWAATDAGSGVAGYEAQANEWGDGYSTVNWYDATLTESQIIAHFGTSYPAMRVRATDVAGNTSAWVYGAPYALSAQQEDAQVVTTSAGWTRIAEQGAMGGHVLRTTTAGRSASITIRARDIGVVATLRPGAGSLRVLVDGQFIKTVSLNGSGVVQQMIIFKKHWAAVGRHTLKVVSAGGGPVELDAFALLS